MTTHTESSPHESSPPAQGGKLYLVGTPIGNLEDLTLRAIRTLKEVDLIACEDTRHTIQLLKHYGITTCTVSYHEHNELTRAPELVMRMEQGSSVALVTDAGMPVISDPGFRLVQLALRHGIPVSPVPGASAFVAALAAAGIPVDKFRFLGFLPSKSGARKKALGEHASALKTLVFYEAPHRLVDMLEDVLETLGDRMVVVAREVTKVHEEFLRGSVSAILTNLKKKPVKGEITVLVGPPTNGAGASSSKASIRQDVERIMAEQKLNERDALKVVARERGFSKSEAYRELQLEKSKKA